MTWVCKALDKDGNTKDRLLRSAARGGQVSIMKYLIEECGAHVDAIGSNGDTPMLAATQFSRKDAVEFLLSKRALVNHGDTAPIIEAVLHNHFDLSRLLLENQAHVDAETDEGRTPLMVAAERNHFKVLRLLLEFRADVNAVCVIFFFFFFCKPENCIRYRSLMSSLRYLSLHSAGILTAPRNC
jgi:uncharacterized protein